MSDNQPDADQIRHEIEETRADLADTVDALSAKLDVKAQAKNKANDVKARAQTRANDVKARVVHAVHNARHHAPPVVQSSLDRAGTALTPVAAKARPYRKHIVSAAAVASALTLVLRSWVRRSR
jgi:ElaB/YqjD/DUF883 family membrane-anchored ribosome-binding protein